MQESEITLIGSADLEEFSALLNKKHRSFFSYFSPNDLDDRQRHWQIVVVDNSLDSSKLDKVLNQADYVIGISFENNSKSLSDLIPWFSLGEEGGLGPGALKYLEMIRQNVIARKALIHFKSQVLELQNDLSLQLQNAQTLHRKLVPVRSAVHKGLKITSKYSVGLSPGGEFFDITHKGNYSILLAHSTSSYLRSTWVMNIFSKLKLQNTIDEDHLQELIQNIERSQDSSEGSEEDSLVLIGINSKDFRVQGYLFGGYDLVLPKGVASVYQNSYPISSKFASSASFQLGLQRNEKLALFSPGFQKSWLDHYNKPSYIDYYYEIEEKELEEIVNESFLKLRSHDLANFPAEDSSLIVMEVESNAIIEV